MTIYLDATENTDQSLMPKIEDAVILPNLEEHTGADILVSNAQLPATSIPLLKLHLEQGAILIQRKSGMDLPASIGNERLSHSIERMKAIGAKHWQSVLLFVGVLTLKDDGLAYVDGRQTNYKYANVKAAMLWWTLRGGSLFELSRKSSIEPWLRGLEAAIDNLHENKTRQVWQPLTIPAETPAQLMEGIPRNSPLFVLAGFKGLGAKTINTINDAFEGDMSVALSWLTDEQSQIKVPGVGPKTKANIRKQLGISDEYNLVLEAIPEQEE